MTYTHTPPHPEQGDQEHQQRVGGGLHVTGKLQRTAIFKDAPQAQACLLLTFVLFFALAHD